MGPFETNKKEGFGYVSEGKQRKEGLKVLLVEFGAIIFVAGGALAFLNYTGIFPVSKVLNTLVPSQNNVAKVSPKTPVAVKPSPNDSLENTSVKPSITVVSDVPTTSVKITDKQKLIDFVDQYQVFGKKFLVEAGKFSDNINKMEIHLTNIEQASNRYYLGGKTPVTSIGTKFQGDTLVLNIYLSDEAYTNPRVMPEKFFLQSLLTLTFRMANDPLGTKLTSEKEKELNKLIGELNLADTGFITISRSKK